MSLNVTIYIFYIIFYFHLENLEKSGNKTREGILKFIFCGNPESIVEITFYYIEREFKSVQLFKSSFKTFNDKLKNCNPRLLSIFPIPKIERYLWNYIAGRRDENPCSSFNGDGDGPVCRACSDKNRRGSECTQAPTSVHCAWYTSIRHLPTHLPTRLTNYLHFSPANALTVRSHRLRDIRPELCSNWPPSVKNPTSQNNRALRTVASKF